MIYHVIPFSLWMITLTLAYIGKKTTTSCGVYDMKDGKVYSTWPVVSWMSGDVPATWLFCQGIDFMFFVLALK